MKNFIVVGASERVVTAVLQGISCFSGSKPVVIGNEETHCLQRSSLCSRHIYVDFRAASDGKATETINRIHAELPDVTVIPADCQGIRLVNRIKSKLHARVIPMPDLATLNQLDDKWHFYELCKENDIEVPTTYYVGAKVNLNFDDLVSKLGLPFVLKPTNESGSFGVQIITSKAHYLQAVKNNESYRFKSLIAQRYIEGDDVDLSLLAIHGKMAAFAIQQVKGSTIQFMHNPRLKEEAEKLCAANSFHGLMHIDARIEKSSGKVFLIESNPRFWASLTASIWCGLNFVQESVRLQRDLTRPVGLVSGTAYLRHPLLRPAAWSTLFHAGPRGCLTRTAMLDTYTLGRFMRDLPGISYRYIGKHVARSAQSANSGYGLR